jgi:hypothetical protein
MYRILVIVTNGLSRIVTRYFENKCTNQVVTCYFVIRTLQNKRNGNE